MGLPFQHLKTEYCHLFFATLGHQLHVSSVRIGNETKYAPRYQECPDTTAMLTSLLGEWPEITKATQELDEKEVDLVILSFHPRLDDHDKSSGLAPEYAVL